jgi:anthranilate synthase/aminodeoxychorismate synthase-like glutamine amidotransferase
MLLLLDNYDSFTGNLLDYFQRLGHAVTVVQNDRIDAAGVMALAPQAMVLAPGPRTPRKAGNLMPIVRHAANFLPILGICLGHQALGECYGAPLVPGPEPVHGKAAAVQHSGDPLFDGLPNPFQAMRYHSLVLQTLEGTPWRGIAHSSDGILMAMRHAELPLIGLQFHPESVGSPEGLRLLANWSREALGNTHP